jgi:predicted nucleotidyltransferase
MQGRSLKSVEECYRGRNVRVFRLDREGVIGRLRERARHLLEQRADVLEVRLFGSLARGDAHPGSDADLFIIVRDGAGPLLERRNPLARMFEGIGIGCDVLAFTESEARASKTSGDAFSRAVFGEGVVLATRQESAQ